MVPLATNGTIGKISNGTIGRIPNARNILEHNTDELEKVQNRATRFVTRNYTREEGIMTGILEQLTWESLKKKRKDNRLILLYKGLKGHSGGCACAGFSPFAKFII